MMKIQKQTFFEDFISHIGVFLRICDRTFISFNKSKERKR